MYGDEIVEKITTQSSVFHTIKTSLPQYGMKQGVVLKGLRGLL
tara:strand:- start:177 stop:305 length:129 start_codon:yes stop_codon:yes gene_type:complete